MWAAFVTLLLITFAPQNASGEENSAVQRLNAGTVEVKLRVTPTRTSTAGKIVAELEVTAPASVLVEIAASESQSRNPLTVVAEHSSGPRSLKPGWMQYRRRVEYRPFLGGNYEVPAFAVSYRSPAGAAQIQTSPVRLTVNSVIDSDPATAEPAGLIPVSAEPMSRHRMIAWAGAAIIALVFAAWFSRRQRGRQLRPIAPTPSPVEIALAAIASLPADDARGLERAIESLRAKGDVPLPRGLDETYQWIRFGSPTPRDFDQFRTDVIRQLRQESRLEPAEKHG
jgi:hypothetical protein